MGSHRRNGQTPDIAGERVGEREREREKEREREGERAGVVIEFRVLPLPPHPSNLLQPLVSPDSGKTLCFPATASQGLATLGNISGGNVVKNATVLAGLVTLLVIVQTCLMSVSH